MLAAGADGESGEDCKEVVRGSGESFERVVEALVGISSVDDDTLEGEITVVMEELEEITDKGLDVGATEGDWTGMVSGGVEGKVLDVL